MQWLLPAFSVWHGREMKHSTSSAEETGLLLIFKEFTGRLRQVGSLTCMKEWSKSSRRYLFRREGMGWNDKGWR